MFSINTFQSSFKILEKDVVKFVSELKEWISKDKNFINNLTGFNIKYSDGVYISFNG
ncbi:MAG: hypothetical protein ACRC7R_08435 [Sarcina sp.]